MMKALPKESVRQVLLEQPLLYSHRSAWAYVALPERGATILDLGCSDGYHANLWRKAGNRVVGVDVRPEKLARARERYPEVDFRLGGAQLPFEDGTFDYVVMLDVIEHVDDERAVLAEVARVLKPRGRLILTTPFRNVFGDWMDQDNLVFNPLINLWRRAKGKNPSVERHRHYDLQQLKELAGPGLSVETVETTGGPDTFGLAVAAKSISLVSRRVLRKNAEGITRRISKAQGLSHFRAWGPLASKINVVFHKAD